MIDNKDIIRIIAKVREKFGNEERYRSLLDLSANIYSMEDRETGNIELVKIEFQYYDKIQILEDRVVYVPEHGYSTVLMCYSTWKDILKV